MEVGILSQRDEVGGKEGSSFIKGAYSWGKRKEKIARGWGVWVWGWVGGGGGA